MASPTVQMDVDTGPAAGPEPGVSTAAEVNPDLSMAAELKPASLNLVMSTAASPIPSSSMAAELNLASSMAEEINTGSSMAAGLNSSSLMVVYPNPGDPNTVNPNLDSSMAEDPDSDPAPRATSEEDDELFLLSFSLMSRATQKSYLRDTDDDERAWLCAYLKQKRLERGEGNEDSSDEEDADEKRLESADADSMELDVPEDGSSRHDGIPRNQLDEMTIGQQNVNSSATWQHIEDFAEDQFRGGLQSTNALQIEASIADKPAGSTGTSHSLTSDGLQGTQPRLTDPVHNNGSPINGVGGHPEPSITHSANPDGLPQEQSGSMVALQAAISSIAELGQSPVPTHTPLVDTSENKGEETTTQTGNVEGSADDLGGQSRASTPPSPASPILLSSDDDTDAEGAPPAPVQYRGRGVAPSPPALIPAVPQSDQRQIARRRIVDPRPLATILAAQQSQNQITHRRVVDTRPAASIPAVVQSENQVPRRRVVDQRPPPPHPAEGLRRELPLYPDLLRYRSRSRSPRAYTNRGGQSEYWRRRSISPVTHGRGRNLHRREEYSGRRGKENRRRSASPARSIDEDAQEEYTAVFKSKPGRPITRDRRRRDSSLSDGEIRDLPRERRRNDHWDAAVRDDRVLNYDDGPDADGRQQTALVLRPRQDADNQLAHQSNNPGLPHIPLNYHCPTHGPLFSCAKLQSHHCQFLIDTTLSMLTIHWSANEQTEVKVIRGRDTRIPITPSYEWLHSHIFGAHLVSPQFRSLAGSEKDALRRAAYRWCTWAVKYIIKRKVKQILAEQFGIGKVGKSGLGMEEVWRWYSPESGEGVPPREMQVGMKAAAYRGQRVLEEGDVPATGRPAIEQGRAETVLSPSPLPESADAFLPQTIQSAIRFPTIPPPDRQPIPSGPGFPGVAPPPSHNQLTMPPPSTSNTRIGTDYTCPWHPTIFECANHTHRQWVCEYLLNKSKNLLHHAWQGGELDRRNHSLPTAAWLADRIFNDNVANMPAGSEEHVGEVVGKWVGVLREEIVAGARGRVEGGWRGEVREL